MEIGVKRTATGFQIRSRISLSSELSFNISWRISIRDGKLCVSLIQFEGAVSVCREVDDVENLVVRTSLGKGKFMVQTRAKSCKADSIAMPCKSWFSIVSELTSLA
jgi:hypothetical protein